MIQRHYKAAEEEEAKQSELTSADNALIEEWCYYTKINPAGLSDTQKRSILFAVKNKTVTPFTNSVLLDLKRRGVKINFD